jgi:TonB-dependent receptor
VTPELSALYSDRWEMKGGSEVGVMLNAAYSHVETRTEGIQLYRMNRMRDVYQPGLVYFPSIVKMNDNLYDRERNGVSAAFQWASADDSLVFTTQFNRSEYDNSWEEYLLQTSPADLSFGESVFYEITGQDPNNPTNDTTIPVPLPGTDPFTFDSLGMFQSGIITTGSGWWGGSAEEAAGFARNAAGQNFVNPCYGWNGCEPMVRGIDTAATTRSNNNQNITQDLSFNLKWAINENMRTNFDVQYVDSEVQNYDIDIAFWTFAVADVDLSGARPQVALSDPINVNMSEGGFANPNNYYIRSIMDHVEDSEGEQLAVRADMEIDLSHDWLDSVKFGLRYADRNQTVRWTTYNWQNVANTWTGSDQWTYFNIDRGADTSGLTNFNGYPDNLFQVRNFNSDFYGGGRITPTEFVFANMKFLQDQQGFANAMSETSLGIPAGRGWDPICSNVGDRADELPGTCYTPSEISDVSEDTMAGYLQLNFGGNEANLFGVPFSGNIGVRYVETNNTSTGGIAFPLLDASYFFERVYNEDGTYTDNPLPRAYENLGCYENIPAEGQPAPAVPFTMGCYITEDDFNYQNGADALSKTDVDHDHWLPSFNIRFDLSEEWLLRFAWSRAMSRPDIGNLKNYVGIGGTLPSTDNADDPLWVKDANGEIVAADVKYSGGAQNPFLKPVMADQWDISLEWYFADVGSLAVAYFNKKFDDYIQFGTYNRIETNNGVTQTNEIRGPLNGEGAKINGFEISYQTFFDFLPSPFDGLGIQANYTHINNKGITNTGVSNVGGEGTVITSQAPDQVSTNVLEGLSDDSYTVIGMYEKGNWSARLAYSWRSEYMVTAVDCCVAVPIWNEDYGQLDGSLRWRVTDSIELGISGSNLTNSETVLRQQVENYEDGGLTLPNAWFQNDRRYTLTFRYFN